MKSRATFVFIIAITLLLLVSGIAIAYESGPADNPFPTQSTESVLNPQSTTAPAIEFGQPGLNFTYAETFGVTEEPYLVDGDHLNDPASVTIDDAGNIWVSEMRGMRVVKFNSNGVYQMSIGRAGIDNDDEDLGFVADTAIDVSGNIWVADFNSHRLLKFKSTGEHEFDLGERGNSGNDNAHFDTPRSLAFDTNGNLFVSDQHNHRIQVFAPDTSYLATLGEPGVTGADNTHFNNPVHIDIDDDDKLFVTDFHNHRVQVFDVSDPADIKYVWTIGISGESGNDNAHLDLPIGISTGTNKIYVVDLINQRIQIFSADTYAYVATIGTGSQGSGNNEFLWPSNVDVDDNGNIYVSEFGNHRVQKFNSNYDYISTIGVTGVPYVTDAQHYNTPYGLAVDTAGNMYFSEEFGNRLIKLNSQGELQWAVGELGVSGGDIDQFNRPRGIALDDHGYIYVAEHDNNRVQIFDSTGNYRATLGASDADGNYQFFAPSDVAIAPSGKIYVADTWNHRIQVYSGNHTYLTTLGEAYVIGTDNGHFHAPKGIFVDHFGNVYVADSYNRRVQVYDQNHNFRFTIGVTSEIGYDHSRLHEPRDITVDQVGNIYVADTWNNRIQVFDSNGAYRTTIGGDWGSENGQFIGIPGVAVDNAGSVYIADAYNHRIQKYAPLALDWVQANHNGFGDKRNGIVTSLASFDDSLFAGTYNYGGSGSQLWRMDAQNNWTLVNASGFGNPANEAIDHMIEFKGRLYAGTWANNTNGSEVWRSSNGVDWEQVASAGFGSPTNSEVFRFFVFNNDLYASTWSDSDSHGTEVWRSSSGDAGSWNRVVVNGFGDPGNQVAVSFTEFDGYLYIGTYNRDGAEVWRSRSGDSESWTRVAASGIDDDSNSSITLEPFGDYLYAGTYNYTNSDNPGAELWRCQLCDGTDWQQITEAKGFGDSENRAIRSLIVFDGAMYAITLNMTSGAEVWRTIDGINWMQTGIDGFGDSKNIQPYWDNSVAVYDDNLFIGTSNHANGGEVWKKLHRQLYLPLITHSPIPSNSPFIAGWRNEDLSSGGITRTDIRIDSNTLFVHMWGKCSPDDCDWGELSTDVSDANDGVLDLTWIAPHAINNQKLSLSPDGKLQIEGHVHYTDDSGRLDRDYAETLFRCQTESQNLLIDSSKDGGAWWYPQHGPYDPNQPHQGKRLADYLRCSGFTVDELPRGVEITSNLLNVHPLIIRANGSGSYSTDELAAYQEFIHKGGDLLLLSSFKLPGDTDALAESFGVRFAGISRGANVVNNFEPHPITEGISELSYIAGSGIVDYPSSATLLGRLSEDSYLDLNDNFEQDSGEPKAAPVLAGMQYGEGRIVFSGTTLMWYRVPPPLLDNTLNWLTETSKELNIQNK